MLFLRSTPKTNAEPLGLTLVEIMVAMGLLAASAMLVLALIPAGIRSAQRAQDLQSAASWSRMLLDTAPVPETFPIPASEREKVFTEKIGSTTYTARRSLSLIPGQPYRYRIEVETSWSESARPLKLAAIRFNPAGPE